MRILPLALAAVSTLGTVQLESDRSYAAVILDAAGRAMKARPSTSRDAAVVASASLAGRAMKARPSGPGAVAGAADEVPYRVQFENEWVKLVRVHYPASSKVPLHDHPPTVTTYVYLSESSPVRFTHPKENNRIATRQPTTPGGFRVSRGGNEVHTVENLGPIASDFLRVEFKTDSAGDGSPYHRDNQRLAHRANTTTDVRFTNKQMRVTRIAVPAGGSAEISTTVGQPALIVSLGDAALTAGGSPLALAKGQERWIAEGKTERLANAGGSPIELLRVDFLTPPRK